MAPSILPVLAGNSHSSEEVKTALAVVAGMYPELAHITHAAQRAIVRLEDDKRDALLAVSLEAQPEQLPARIEYLKEILQRSCLVAA